MDFAKTVAFNGLLQNKKKICPICRGEYKLTYSKLQ